VMQECPVRMSMKWVFGVVRTLQNLNWGPISHAFKAVMAADTAVGELSQRAVGQQRWWLRQHGYNDLRWKSIMCKSSRTSHIYTCELRGFGVLICNKTLKVFFSRFRILMKSAVNKMIKSCFLGLNLDCACLKSVYGDLEIITVLLN
jgi:hypothetical protein